MFFLVESKFLHSAIILTFDWADLPQALMLCYIMAVAKNENGGIFGPDIYMDGECHKVQEKPFENGF